MIALRKRPLHLGKYPMEKIRRVAVPTTRIGDQIPRMPKRADFFMRARFGDLGPRPQREVNRFVLKYPISRAIGALMLAQVPFQDGEVATSKAPLTDELQQLAAHVKAMCYFLDADMVGICRIPDYAWYSHDRDGVPIERKHTHAIVILVDQGFQTLDGASGDDWISGAQSYRAYLKGSTIACTVAGYIRQLGFEARAHTAPDSEVLQLPLILLAGLGELSRIGEVVLNPFLGPRFKSTVVTTTLEMAVDRPIDFGLQDFCNKCLKCARECPCAAISFGDKVMFNGYEMWKPDVEACTRYRVANPYGSACGRCIKVCPFNKQGLLHHRLGLWLVIRFPFLRRLFIWLDDALGYGRRNTIWKWWFDLEWRDDILSRPKKTNSRDLRPERTPPPRQIIPLYLADTAPAPNSREAQPLDRRAARERRAGLESQAGDGR